VTAPILNWEKAIMDLDTLAGENTQIPDERAGEVLEF
jgi:hypothetical protein